MIWRCDLVPQYLAYKAEIDAALQEVLASGRYILAEQVGAFEQEFARYLGVRHAIGVANGTDALTLALVALGIGPGDEVITTPFTAIPTVSAIVDTGATPVFVDVRPDTFLLDLDQVGAAVGPRTRAVVPVHLFGNVVDVAQLRARVGPEVAVVEDAAQAHGSTRAGRHAGTLGSCGAFSFYPTKNLGGYGDGGALVTDDEALAERVRRLRTYGMVDKDHIVEHGINTRLDELQAAVLRVKLRHLDAMNARRRVLAARYRERILPGVLGWQEVPADVVPNWHVLAALVSGDRDGLVQRLADDGIQTNVYYPLPLYRQEAHRRRFGAHRPLPVVEGLCARILALPLYAELPEATQDVVIDALLRHARREGPA
jgi:dTDP-4-amino-4,6-dideoxygalactose transaminase